jgi:hypothetical protein
MFELAPATLDRDLVAWLDQSLDLDWTARFYIRHEHMTVVDGHTTEGRLSV